MLRLSSVSFSGKIVLLTLFTVVFVGGATFGSANYFFRKAFEEQGRERTYLASTAVQATLDDLMANVKRLAVSFSTHKDLIDAVENRNAGLLQSIGKELIAANGLDIMTIADAKGNVIARGHSDKTGDTVSSQINVRKAQAGEVSVGLEEGTVVKYSLRAGAPIKINDRLVGTITPGIDLTASTRFVDEIKKRYNVECTIFKDDERVSTTLERDGKRLIGTKMDNPAVIETVLRKGQKFFAPNMIAGRSYNTVYWPIVAPDGKISGMFFIGYERSLIDGATHTVTVACLVAVLSIGLLMAVAGFFICRSLVKPMLKSISSIDRGVNEVSAAAEEVSSSSQELAEGASEQAASIEETSSSLEEMSSMTKQNANNARQANELMTRTKESVSRSSQMMDHLTASMTEISGASEETSKIIKTIDEIAFQTNLLALNAAVEAARAGEAGAGFAVVADEVRNLAMRAAEAAKSTAELIEGTVKKVHDGSELVGATEKEFREVALNVSRSSELVGEISAASVEQAQGIEQINKAVGEMDRVVQQNAAAAEESASASREMSGQANRMKVRVEELVQRISGAGAKGSREVKPVKSKGRASSPVKVLDIPARRPGDRTKEDTHPEGTRRRRLTAPDAQELSDF